MSFESRPVGTPGAGATRRAAVRRGVGALVALAWFASTAACGSGAASNEADGGGGAAVRLRPSPLPKPGEAPPEGILAEILRDPKPIDAVDSEPFARAVVEAAYRDGDLATVMDVVYWSHRRCRIGVFPCSELGSTARRVGALVPLVPSAALRPKGMVASEFEPVAASVTRLEVGNLPEGEPELPYHPKQGEALFRFQDHHGMARYLLLMRTGTSWKVLFVGGMTELRDL